MLALARPAIDRRTRAFLALAAGAPLSILILAFDLSRFVVVTQFTAMLAILFIVSTPQASGTATPDRPPSRTTQYAVGTFAGVLLMLPLIYGYFDATLIVSNQLLDNIPVVGPHLRAIYATIPQ
jgi:ribose/xylose/arabinose/galactoside ABC-type transport system permease subunit